MKLEALSILLCTTLLAGFTITAHADVHVGIGIGVAPPVVVSPPPVYYAPPAWLLRSSSPAGLLRPGNRGRRMGWP